MFKVLYHKGTVVFKQIGGKTAIGVRNFPCAESGAHTLNKVIPQNPNAYT